MILVWIILVIKFRPYKLHGLISKIHGKSIHSPWEKTCKIHRMKLVDYIKTGD